MEVIQLVGQEHDLVTNLNKLGTELRDENFRGTEAVFNIIPNLADIFIKHDDRAVSLEVLRALINVTADNDRNRLKLLECTEFWRSIELRIDSERVPILLTQFTKNTDHLMDFMRFFYDLNIHPPLLRILQREFDPLILEFLGELLVPELILNQEFRPEAEHYLRAFISIYETEELEEEDYEYLSLLLYNLTQFHDLDSSPISSVFPLFDKYKTSNSKINRQLFSTVGNLSSMDGFDDLSIVEYSISHIDVSNLYLKAGYYLAIGNYVNSKEKADLINGLIGQTFLTEYFNNVFTDVIQYQSIHMIKNLLNESNYLPIINHQNLPAYTKVLVDNQNYYKEIYDNYVIFIRKLINLTFPSLSIYDYEQLWHLLDSEGVFIILSEYVDVRPSQLNKKILDALFLKDLPIEATRILERIKYQAIVLKSKRDVLTSTYPQFAEFSHKFLVQFRKLQEMLEKSDQNSPQYGILLNNSKFVSASLMSLEVPEINQIATQILAISAT